MTQSMLEQFTNMLNSRFALGAAPAPALPLKMSKSFRETVSYPTINVGKHNNFCLDPSQHHEHVLSCGHVIVTALPSEPCAPNCHHVADTVNNMDKSMKVKKAMAMKNGRTVSVKSFYCDACVETEFESRIPSTVSSTHAETRRANLRAEEAKGRGKARRFRKCYIGLKTTSVPCYNNGSVSSKYEPRKEHHPFDTSLPQVGDNMFEDVDPNPTEPATAEMLAETTETGSLQPEVVGCKNDEDGQREASTKGRGRRSTNKSATEDKQAPQRPSRASTKRKTWHYRDKEEDGDDEDDEDEDDGEEEETAPPPKRKRVSTWKQRAKK